MHLVLASIALATPEGSAYRAALTPVCTSESTVVFLLQESDHDGTYYGAKTAFRWASYDVTARRWSLVPALDVHEYAPLDPGGDARAPEKLAGKGNLAQFLGPRASCSLPDPVENDDFTYGIGPDGLLVWWGSASRPVATGDAWVFTSLGEQPLVSPPVETECRLRDVRAFDAPNDHTLLIARGSNCDTDSHPLRVFTVAKLALTHTRSVTLNQAGLDALRSGNAGEAIVRFTGALLQDRTNTTATYDLACAYARAGDARSAVGVLSQLPREGLAAKLAADSDFEGVRGAAIFVEFVGGR
ncbi:hypothetical protein LBMAG42_09110 [Deltaproteobacteria bacterium]|nr:hypothetical protein LBMAG42_09110 [Deltaproteobacteria bacterium]